MHFDVVIRTFKLGSSLLWLRSPHVGKSKVGQSPIQLAFEIFENKKIGL
jgi:hypothetical protein